jgi:hypothetical protein
MLHNTGRTSDQVLTAPGFPPFANTPTSSAKPTTTNFAALVVNCSKVETVANS